ncbi:unnamed protein product [Auanema sp. JU1783]|nr:unnamed protein product [Auanema sp. JU1783]
MTEWLGENQVVAVIIFIIAGIGMSCNWFVVAFISQVPTLQNAFGRLTTSQALSEAVHLTIFTFFVAPMVFFQVDAMEDISKYFGHVLLICYDICIYCHVLISLNRMTAVMLPLQYERIFSMRNTKKMIIVVWALAILPSIYFYIIEDCDFYYTGDYWHFVFSSTPVCAVIAWYTDFLKYVSIVIMIAFIDMFTLVRVHALNVSVFRNGTSSTVRRCRKADELNFLEQTCLQGAFFVCELLTYFVLYQYFESRYIKFFFTTFAWICVHSADGFITLIFNKDFHQIWKKSVRNIKIDAKTFTTSHSKTPNGLGNSRDDTSNRF